jgi:excinuclease ABC subunit B
MQNAIDETNRRRKIQAEYNEKHGITPKTIYKSIQDVLAVTRVADAKADQLVTGKGGTDDEFLAAWKGMSAEEREELLHQMEQKMFEAATKMEFETAAEIRDQIDLYRSSIDPSHRHFSAKKVRSRRG